MAGSTDAIASASKASKKVATPTMIRTFTCQAEVGRRSMRATTWSAMWSPGCPAEAFAVAVTAGYPDGLHARIAARMGLAPDRPRGVDHQLELRALVGLAQRIAGRGAGK